MSEENVQGGAFGGIARVKFSAFNEAKESFVGKTVAQVRANRAPIWNIDATAEAYRGKEKLDENYTIMAGDEITFQRRLGEKG